MTIHTALFDSPKSIIQYSLHFLCQFLQMEIHQEGATTISAFSFLLFDASFLCLRNLQQTTEATDLWFLTFGPKIWRIVLHPRKLIWNPKIGGWKMSSLLGRHILRCYVSFCLGCVYFASSPTFWSKIWRELFQDLPFRNASRSSCPGTSVWVKGRAMAKRPEASNQNTSKHHSPCGSILCSCSCLMLWNSGSKGGRNGKAK